MQFFKRLIHSSIHKILFFICLAVFLLPFLYGVMGIIQIITIMAVAVLAEIKYKFFEKFLKKESVIPLIFSILLSLYILLEKHLYPHYAFGESIKEPWLRNGYLIIQIIGISLLVYPVFNYIFSRIFEKKEFNLKKYIRSFIMTGTLFLTVFIYFPCDSFLNNLSDFSFPFQSFIGYELLYFLSFSVLISFAVAFLKEKIYWKVIAFVIGIDICVYIQYMFLNQKLILIDGESMNWENYRVFSVLTFVLWIAVIAGIIITEVKNHRIVEKVLEKIPAFISGIQILTVFILIISAGNKAYEYKTDYLSAEEQYTVSSEENLIVFILDATDNAYFEEILRNNPDAFEGFEDFTLYTNTCSVLDFTTTSVTQMFTGMDFDYDIPMNEWIENSWRSAKADEFYDRFHKAGFVVNGYDCTFKDERKRINKLDNCISVNKKNGYSDIKIYIPGVLRDFGKLSLYRALPFALKKYVDYEHIDFYSHVRATDGVEVDNYEFEREMDLKVSENENNYFIVQHLNGTHFPCKDVIGETEHLLKIIRSYIEQLKTYGKYDRSSVIITSDHGMHNEGKYEKAATPILMIKEKNASRSEMAFSGAPVSHKDFQATLLDCAGLYDKEKDESLFGRSMFDIGENEQRSRSWTDRVDGTYYEYVYTGNTETLRQMVSEGAAAKKTKIIN